MGVSAAKRVEPDVCFPSPHRHASGHRLTGQWAIPFITWEKPVEPAAAQSLDQRHPFGMNGRASQCGGSLPPRRVESPLQLWDGYSTREKAESTIHGKAVILPHRHKMALMFWKNGHVPADQPENSNGQGCRDEEICKLKAQAGRSEPQGAWNDTPEQM